MVSSIPAFNWASIVFLWRGLSFVIDSRVPIPIPSAPNANAAAIPLPSAIPPTATTGILTLSTIAGTRTKVVTCPPCAAASCPVTCNASAPCFSAANACFSVTTVAITLPPYL